MSWRLNACNLIIIFFIGKKNILKGGAEKAARGTKREPYPFTKTNKNIYNPSDDNITDWKIKKLGLEKWEAC